MSKIDDAQPAGRTCKCGTPSEIHDEILAALSTTFTVGEVDDLLNLCEECCATDRELTDLVAEHWDYFAPDSLTVWWLARHIEEMILSREQLHEALRSKWGVR